MTSFRQIAQRMDPVRPPRRLRGGGGHPREGFQEWYYEPAISALGYSSEIGRWHQLDKGLGQMHRTLQGGPVLSLREITRRHAPPSHRIRLLWYNTWLIDPPGSDNDPPELETRARLIGDRIGSGDWDVVAMCEVFGEDARNRVSEAAGVHREYRSAWGGSDPGSYLDSGLLDLAFGNVYLGRGSWHSFEAEGEGFDSSDIGVDIEVFASKGVLHREVVVRAPRREPETVLHLFSTHLHAESPEVRQRQIAELVEYVRRSGSDDAPKLVVGDFNVFDQGGRRPVTGGIYEPDDWTTDTEYDQLLRAMAGFEDLWLTRGGLAASTLSSSDYTRTCLFDQSAARAHRYCDDYPPGSLTGEQVPGKRIDYAFLERPRAHHRVVVDVGRVRRRPFFRDRILFSDSRPELVLRADRFWTDVPPAPGSVSSALFPSRYAGYLSDHLGLEMDFFISHRNVG